MMGIYLMIVLIAIILIVSSKLHFLSNKSKFRVSSISTALIIALLAVGGCSGQDSGGVKQQAQSEDLLEVHFIDVGQGDSILVKNGSKAMLIDTGTKNNSVRLKKYLDQQGITKLDYVIGTNPLKDHIGGMIDLIENYEISRIILPQIDTLNKTFKDLQMEMLARYMKPIKPEPGKNYTLGDASFMILAPNSTNYDGLADYSIVVKLIYGETSFLLTGDAGKISEQEMLDMEFDLSANVLKLGRHGSSSSTTDEFLSAVNPDSAVISVGKDNDYLHPHMGTMLKLKDREIPVYRTDEQGSIVAVSDGHSITFNIEPGTYVWPEIVIAEDKGENTADLEDNGLNNEIKESATVFVSENSNKYHAEGCSFLDEKAVEITLEEALEAGYEPCLLCKP